MRRTAITALVALMVALAGCGATTQGGLTTTQTDDATNAIEPTSGMGSGSTGTIAFYVSDQPAAIEDFEHLNVTIQRIGLKPAGADDDEESSDGAESDDGNESEDENETTTTVTTTATTTNETTEERTNTSTTTTTETLENETTEAPENDSEDDEAEDEQDEEEREEGEDEDDDEEREVEEAEDEKDDEKAGWVTYDVDNRTVDLTELRGENATRLANLSAPSGTYTTVFVYVSDVHGVLKNGEEVRVKLPSQKLQLHTTFEIGANASAEFVYDIAVHKAGNSGKYILKPNIAESGTDVPIRDVDREREHRSEMNDGEEHGDDEMDEHDEEDMGEHDEMNETEGEHGQDESEMGEGHDGNGMDDQDGNGMDDESEHGGGEPGDGADHEDRFSIALDGNVTAGGTVTVSVTNAQDKAVSGAAVSVNGDSVGETDGDGAIEITVPEGAEELEITVRTPGGAEIDFERSLEG